MANDPDFKYELELDDNNRVAIAIFDEWAVIRIEYLSQNGKWYQSKTKQGETRKLSCTKDKLHNLANAIMFAADWVEAPTDEHLSENEIETDKDIPF